MTDTIKHSLTEDMKAAMRSGDKNKLAALRLILAAVKQIEVDERVTVDDQRMLTIFDSMLKQRRDSIQQYQQANRQDLIEVEQFEMQVIQTYLPPQLNEAELHQLISAAMQKTGATTVRDMGNVMAELKPQLQGRADMGQVSQMVKQSLS